MNNKRTLHSYFFRHHLIVVTGSSTNCFVNHKVGDINIIFDQIIIVDEIKSLSLILISWTSAFIFASPVLIQTSLEVHQLDDHVVQILG